MKHINIEAEQAVLGAIIADNRQLHRVADILSTHHFLDAEHQAIWLEINSLSNQGMTATAVTMNVENDKRQYLARLAGLGSSVLDVRSHAMVVVSRYKRFLMEDIAQQLAEYANNYDVNEMDSLAKISSQITSLVEDGGRKSVFSAKQVYAEIIERMQGELPCYSTGIPLLDAAMAGGLYEARMYAFGGRPKAGKTLMMGTIASALAKQNVSTLFIAAEMGRIEIMQRMIAGDLNRGVMAFIEDRNNPNFVEQVVDYQQNYQPPLWFIDEPRITFNRLKQLVYSQISRRKAKVIILDGLNLVSGRSESENEAQHQLEVSQWLAEVCKREKVCVVTSQQLNRDGGLRGSDGALMAGDQVWKMHRPSDENNGIWLELSDSRYTQKQNIGNDDVQYLQIKSGCRVEQVI